MNGTDTEHSPKCIVCSLEDKQSMTISYTVLNIDPQLNYIFIADVLNYFNDSKTKNESYFSECFYY